MFCSKCGVKNNDDAKFCKECGHTLNKSDESSTKSPHTNSVDKTTKPPKSVLLYALAPIGILIAVVTIWGVANLFVDPEDPSSFILFLNNVIIPLLFGFSFLAVPVSIAYAIWTNSKRFDGTIKCGNCGYTGKGQKGRSIWAQVVVWVLFFVFWPITLIYYLVTHSYHCPECRSTFVGLKDKLGGYSAPRSGLGPLGIILIVLVVIAIIGILASVVLASLNSARDKGADAAIKANLNNLRAEAELYYDENLESYSGFCDDSGTKSKLEGVTTNKASGYACKDSDDEYAVSMPLSTDNYYCIDSWGTAVEVNRPILNQTTCPPPSSSQTSLHDGWTSIIAKNGLFQVDLPKDASLSDESEGVDGIAYMASEGDDVVYIVKYEDWSEVYEEVFTGYVDVETRRNILMRNFELNVEELGIYDEVSQLSTFGTRQSLKFSGKMSSDGDIFNIEGEIIGDGQNMYELWVIYSPGTTQNLTRVRGSLIIN